MRWDAVSRSDATCWPWLAAGDVGRDAARRAARTEVFGTRESVSERLRIKETVPFKSTPMARYFTAGKAEVPKRNPPHPGAAIHGEQSLTSVTTDALPLI